MPQLIVHKGRTNIVALKLPYDASNDVFTSEIRVDKDPESELLATWDVSFETDGEDGNLRLVLDDSVTSEITKSTGYMDVKRVTSGEPVPVFDEPLEVLFRPAITV